MRTKYLFITLIISATYISSYAATYYVATDGDNSNPGTISQPWADPVYGSAQLEAGDTMYLRGGTYTVAGGSGSNIRPYADNVTISGYTDEDVYIDGGSFPTGTILVANGYDNITYKNMRIKGMAYLVNTSGSTLENLEIWEGGDGFTGSTDFGELVYINTTTNVTVRNCKLHDNVHSIASGGNNSPAIMEYDSSGLLIENNDIYNIVHSGIYLKDNPENITIRFNHFYNCGYSGVQATGQDQGDTVDVYQNVFRGNGASEAFQYGAIMIYGYLTNFNIYNNTFIGNNVDIKEIVSGGVTSTYVWNNISYNPTQYHVGSKDTEAFLIDYIDYNTYYGGSWEYMRTAKTTLADWQAATSKDANSSVVDPGFVNPTGTLPEDFKRTSYPTDGRGGNYSSVRGAYITGAEVIGAGAQAAIGGRFSGSLSGGGVLR